MRFYEFGIIRKGLAKATFRDIEQLVDSDRYQSKMMKSLLFNMQTMETKRKKIIRMVYTYGHGTDTYEHIKNIIKQYKSGKIKLIDAR